MEAENIALLAALSLKGCVFGGFLLVVYYYGFAILSLPLFPCAYALDSNCFKNFLRFLAA